MVFAERVARAAAMGASQKYSLRWNDFNLNVASTFRDLHVRQVTRSNGDDDDDDGDDDDDDDDGDDDDDEDDHNDDMVAVSVSHDTVTC